MANVDSPNGAQPKGQPLRTNKYTAGGTIRIGDFVKFNSSGQVVVAATAEALCGVAATYAESGEAVSVWDHPDQLYICQADDANIAAQTDINLNCDIVATAGSARTSAMEVDASTKATTATLQLKVLGLDERIGNAFGAQAKVVCKINNHQLGQSTGTAGV